MNTLTKKALEKLSEERSEKIRRVWDGGGLYAQVSPKGKISFAMKYRHKGEEKREGLGRWPSVSLDDARRRARQIRAALDRREDPTPQVSNAVTFKEAATEWMDINKSRLKPRTMTQVKRYLDACTDEFGDTALKEVKPLDVLAVLRKFEKRGAYESAKRARIYTGAVFDYAIALGRADANPAAPLKAKGVLRARPAVVHHAAMPADKIPDFLQKITTGNFHPSIRAALAFTMLTALRTGEVLELRWSDLADDGRSLTIPANRMKGGKPHTVFLSTQAQAVIAGIKPFSEGRDHVFPGRDPRGPLSNMAMLMVLNRMAPGFTVHGFRSSFSTWANAQADIPPHLVERCLAHSSGDKVAAAYNRHAYDKEAAAVWQRWADAISPKAKKKKPRK